ncbi:MAG: sugar ABC transporter permease [Xanthomonadales bacterium]|nr:sugar ABC transporter permease [Xanthomonadales bacterium]
MVGSPIGIALGLMIALLVNRPIFGRNIYRTIIFMSFPVMTVATGVIWLWLFSEKTGLINYFLMYIGLIDHSQPFLEDFNLALPSIVLVSIWQVVGLYMIIILTGLQNIPPSIYQAAKIDGANSWQQFWLITFPLLRPSIFLCLIIGIINSFNAFDLVYVMTGGGPGHATELLITYIYKTAFTLARFDYAAAITVINFSLFLALTWLVNRMSGGNAGAVETN